ESAVEFHRDGEDRAGRRRGPGRGAGAVPRVRGLARHRSRVPGLRHRAGRLARRLHAAARPAADRAGGPPRDRRRRAAAPRPRRLRGQAPLRAARGPRHRPRPAPHGRASRRGEGDRLRAPAPRHAARDEGGHRPLSLARLPSDRSLSLQPRRGHTLSREGPMKIPIYQVDAFTSRVFGGNPAAVCPLQSWLDDATLQSIAAENNLAETAYFVGGDGKYDIRWMTPAAEVDLCGHATLASAWVVMNR